jgi:hypothetical protein
LSREDDRILIHRLALGELDEREAGLARARIEADPALGELLEQLQDLHARVRDAFPEPPPLPGARAFVEMLRRVTPGTEPAGDRRGAAARARAPARYVTDEAWEPVLRAADRAGESEWVVRHALAPAPEPDSEAHLFHLREIPREGGLGVELELYAGDVLALRSEVLLLSAFAGDYAPRRGTVFGAIADRFGLRFEQGPPPGAVRHPGGLLHFRGVTTEAFRALWVIELVEPGRPFSMPDLRAALDTVGAHLPEMLAGGATSLTLPLLGTGGQGLDPRPVARELLSAAERWAARSPRLRSLRVVTRSFEHVAILNRALDDRGHGTANSALALACTELRRRIERAASEPVQLALKQLLQIATASEPSLPSIALEGRRVAEAVLREMGRREAEEAGAQAPLFAPADSPRGESLAPQLQLLLERGRAAASGAEVDANDAVMVVYAALRAAEAVRG